MNSLAGKKSKVDSEIIQARKIHLDGNFELAEKKYQKLLKKYPGHPHLLAFMGVLQLQMDRYEKALKLLNRAYAKDSKNSDLPYNIALAKYKLHQYEESIKSYKECIELNPQHDRAHYMMARAYIKWDCEKYRPLALQAFLKDLEVTERFESLISVAEILISQNRFEECRAICKKILEIEPTNEIGLYIMGKSLLARDFKLAEVDHKFIEPALKVGNLILQAHPNTWRGHDLIAEALVMAGEDQLAMPHLEKVRELNPDSTLYGANVAVLLLRQGNLKAGWDEIGNRRGRAKYYGMDQSFLDRCPAPFWQGELEEGKHIFIAGEQGIGDQILHAQMIQDLLQAGMKVSMTCTEKIKSLFERSLPMVTFHGSKGDIPEEILNSIDYKTDLLELGKFLRQDLSHFKKPFYFLKPEPKMAQCFKDNYEQFGQKLKVGISWRSASVSAGGLKSTDLKQWEKILKIPNVQFVSVQYKIEKQEIEDVCNQFGVDIFVDNFDPFCSIEKATAQLTALDLIISVSNATVHLAGQLNIPTWVILGNRPLWHWFESGSTSVWYESVKLYRQPQLQSWTPVLDEISKDLLEHTKHL